LPLRTRASMDLLLTSSFKVGSSLKTHLMTSSINKILNHTEILIASAIGSIDGQNTSRARKKLFPTSSLLVNASQKRLSNVAQIQMPEQRCAQSTCCATEPADMVHLSACAPQTCHSHLATVTLCPSDLPQSTLCPSDLPQSPCALATVTLCPCHSHLVPLKIATVTLPQSPCHGHLASHLMPLRLASHFSTVTLCPTDLPQSPFGLATVTLCPSDLPQSPFGLATVTLCPSDLPQSPFALATVTLCPSDLPQSPCTLNMAVISLAAHFAALPIHYKKRPNMRSFTTLTSATAVVASG